MECGRAFNRAPPPQHTHCCVFSVIMGQQNVFSSFMLQLLSYFAHQSHVNVSCVFACLRIKIFFQHFL